MPNIQSDALHYLALAYTPGLGPVRSRRLIAHLGSAEAIFNASQADIEQVEGIGPGVARNVIKESKRAIGRAEKELRLAEKLEATVIAQSNPRFPQLLSPLPDCPLVLFVRGQIDPDDQFSLGIVGSRRCSQYGLEQSGRFSTQLSARGITIVSGGARGIDTAAHRGALQAHGRTVVVLGCGLSHCYPPENLALFDSVVDGGGAIVTELPFDSPPEPRNFPARNRIISGMSLGVLVVEAGKRSGALITARQATEDQGREVFALPGRVDSIACEGSLDLLKSGGAQLVTEPADIINSLEAPAWHAHRGTHEARYTPTGGSITPKATSKLPIPGGNSGELIFEACRDGKTPDQLSVATGLDIAAVGQTITLLEISGLVKRNGSKIEQSR
jgi:DNA processing protein